MQSILQKEKRCFCCGTAAGLHCHHVFYGTSNRKHSERYGLTVFLCGFHHNLSNNGVHFNKPLDTKIKQYAQAKFEESHTREDFIRIFGRSWL